MKGGKQMKAELKSSTATACAPPAEMDWHQIDWSKCHKNVKRLQARIVKATEEGRWGKVKTLQHLLTHSFSGKAVAVRRVTENQGRRTPGVDNETWSTPKSKSTAVMSLKQRGYKPQPLRRIYIPKANGKKRPLGIPTMKDRAMQALYLLALEPIAETTADRNSYGFRKERSCADAVGACHTALSTKGGAQWVLEGDIKGCFDNISHNWMIENIPLDKSILRKWLKAGYIEKKNLFPTEAGTPQGGIISPVLANMTLDGLEELLRKKFKPYWKIKYNPKVHLIRYADDFVITGYSKELLESKVKPLVEEFLAERGLTLSPEKTKITHIREGFDFLGKTIRKYRNGKTLVKPSKKSVLEFTKNIRGIRRGHMTVSQEKLIEKLNPVIRGWGNFFQTDSAKKTFSSMGYVIWKNLWRWANRRHPNKGKKWVKRRYFIHRNSRDWIFAAKSGKELFDIDSIPIRRHVKIKSEANPFDPKWEEYFEQRQGFKMNLSLAGKRKLRALWRSQEGICPVCDQKITINTGWANHHIVWKSKGGQEGNQNRVLLHINCHNQVHNQKLTVKKPVPRQRSQRKA